ncbi:DNA methyltransferase [Burkholderia pseudomallei]|uniref:DNA methyltransferase n=1 Tax=Burkholderia pseudomallei TaxID=28450 RepID=UPI0011786CF3
MSSNEGGSVFDHLGGSSTTYAMAKLKKLKWIGVEIGPTDGIVERLPRRTSPVRVGARGS